MGMFDWYEPRPPLACPKCNATLGEWQGKSGPCALFEWVQGLRTPARQVVDDDAALTPAEREQFVLPDDFELYTTCDSCDLWVDAQGSCDAGVWTQTALVNPLEPPGLPAEWMPLQVHDRDHLLAELGREIGPGHVLEKRRLFPLARRRNRDDVLVRVIGGESPLWVVHLTWAAASDPAWPNARAFDSLTSLVSSEGVRPVDSTRVSRLTAAAVSWQPRQSGRCR